MCLSNARAALTSGYDWSGRVPQMVCEPGCAYRIKDLCDLDELLGWEPLGSDRGKLILWVSLCRSSRTRSRALRPSVESVEPTCHASG